MKTASDSYFKRFLPTIERSGKKNKNLQSINLKITKKKNGKHL